MSFFNKFFKNIVKTSQKEEGEKEMDQEDDLSIDELFVKKFIHKGGKFLYCADLEEVEKNLVQVLQENQWNNVVTFDEEVRELLTSIKSAKTSKIISSLPFMTHCECLIAHDGSIMFSSKQLKDKKLKELPNNFIVYAKTSQIVNDSSRLEIM